MSEQPEQPRNNLPEQPPAARLLTLNNLNNFPTIFLTRRDSHVSAAVAASVSITFFINKMFRLFWLFYINSINGFLENNLPNNLLGGCS